MDANAFARAVQQRLRSDLAQTALEEKRWRLFLDMLQACRAYVPSAACCDDWHLDYDADTLKGALRSFAHITPEEDARLLTPSATTIRNDRRALARTHIRRLIWATLETILDARAVQTDDTQAVARLIVLADLFPGDYHYFGINISVDLWSNDGVSYAPAAATKEYQAYAAEFNVPGRAKWVKSATNHYLEYLYEPTPPQSERTRVASLLQVAGEELCAPLRDCLTAAGLPPDEDGEIT